MADTRWKDWRERRGGKNKTRQKERMNTYMGENRKDELDGLEWPLLAVLSVVPFLHAANPRVMPRLAKRRER